MKFACIFLVNIKMSVGTCFYKWLSLFDVSSFWNSETSKWWKKMIKPSKVCNKKYLTLSWWQLAITSGVLLLINTLRLRQNGRLFTDDTFKCIFLNENIRISIKIALKFVPKGLINNVPALVPIMAWRRPGDKPLSEPMLVRSLTHICVTRPQWVKLKMQHMAIWLFILQSNMITSCQGDSVNHLRAKLFRGNIKHIFTFYVIPPHWYDTGGWNPSSHKTRTNPFYIVNIMATGVLATQGARTSAAMMLT